MNRRAVHKMGRTKELEMQTFSVLSYTEAVRYAGRDLTRKVQ